MARALLSALFGVALFAALAAFAAMSLIAPENLADAVEAADLPKIVEETGAAEAIAAQVEEYRREAGDGALARWGITEPIDAASVSEALGSREASEALAGIAEKYADALARGELDYSLDSGDVVEALQALEPEIRREFGYELSEADYGMVEEYIDERGGMEDLSVSRLLGSGQTMQALEPIAAAMPAVHRMQPLSALLAGLLAFNIAALNARRVRNAFFFVGTPAVAMGLVLSLSGVLSGMLGGGAAGWAVSALVGPLLNIGFAMLAAGTALIIAFIASNVVLGARSARILGGQGDGVSSSPLFAVCVAAVNAAAFCVGVSLWLL